MTTDTALSEPKQTYIFRGIEDRFGPCSVVKNGITFGVRVRLHENHGTLESRVSMSSYSKLGVIKQESIVVLVCAPGTRLWQSPVIVVALAKYIIGKRLSGA